jgi:hypothetical protein
VEEEAQLQGIVGLDGAGLTTVLEGCAYVYETAAYHNLKSAALGQSLLALGVGEAQAVAVVGVWTAESAALIGRLRAKVLGAPQVLRGSSWRLTLGMGDVGATATGEAAAAVDLLVGSEGAGGAGGTEKAITLGFSKGELLDFLGKLDLVQQQLDSLS